MPFSRAEMTSWAPLKPNGGCGQNDMGVDQKVLYAHDHWLDNHEKNKIFPTWEKFPMLISGPHVASG